MTPANLLRGDHVRLTAIEPRDLPALARWYEDAEFARRWDADPSAPKTEKQVSDYVESQQRSGTAFAFAVRLLNDDNLIGYCELDGIIWSQGSGWMSIGIGDPAYHSKGYGGEAMRLLLRFAFAELNLRRAQLTVFSYNDPAIRLYEKLGFRREGTFREFLRRDGELFDMLLYGLLRREWEDAHHD